MNKLSLVIGIGIIELNSGIIKVILYQVSSLSKSEASKIVDKKIRKEIRGFVHKKGGFKLMNIVGDRKFRVIMKTRINKKDYFAIGWEDTRVLANDITEEILIEKLKKYGMNDAKVGNVDLRITFKNSKIIEWSEYGVLQEFNQTNLIT